MGSSKEIAQVDEEPLFLETYVGCFFSFLDGDNEPLSKAEDCWKRFVVQNSATK